MRSAALLVAALAATVALTGCSIGTSAPTPKVSDAPTSAPATPTVKPVAKPTGPALPTDALLAVSSTVSQANGAKLALTLVVHAPVLWNSPAGTAMSTAITTKCDGEIDSGVLAAGNYRIVETDVTAAVVRSPAWGKVPVGVNPIGGPDSGFNEVAAAPLSQVEILGPTPGPGDYVPNCLQPAVLTGPGTGKAYFAYGTDVSGSDPATAWASDDFGFSIPATADGSTPIPLTFSGCSITVTPLATSSAPGHTWVTGTVNNTECLAYS